MRLIVLPVLALLAGCPASAPIIKTEVIEKPVPVFCKVEMPKECRDRYAMDELQPGADPVQVNRSVLAEIEQRRACEVKLKVAVGGCNAGGK